jgi:hypothetical protein
MDFEGPSKQVVMHHLRILHDDGYIYAEDATSADGIYYIPDGLTGRGHDFLDAARNETVWNNTKEVVRKYGGPVPLEVFKALLIKGASTFFGLG